MPPKKPLKPYADFPLYAHSGGVWAKKIRGKVHYFGSWNDPAGALDNYLTQKDYLHAGKRPPTPANSVANLLDKFMDQKQSFLTTSDITEETFKEYESVCVLINNHFGKQRPLSSLALTDFQALRVALAKGQRKGKVQVAATTLKRRLTIARMVFASQPIEFRKALKAPPKKLIRQQRKLKGEQLYEASEVRQLVAKAPPALKAMILLGINCGFGNKDCFTLPTRAVDLKAGWHNYERPKTEVARRCWLWPETVRAIKKVSGKRLVFEGEWDRFKVRDQFSALCKKTNVINRQFYSLRRTFETIATTADVNQAVIDRIMGHERNDMATVYRQKIFDDMIRKCAIHVQSWYLGKITIQ